MRTEKKALLSVFQKDGLEVFAKGLIDLNFSLVSSGGTARYLKEKGFEVTDVAEITGYPAIIGHRVVTLHPNIHAGILALDNPEHEADLEKYKIDRFHLVCVDLYPVAEAIAQDGANVDSVMEMTDIGGPTMIRGAAKNHKSIITICDPNDRQWVIKELQKSGDLSKDQRRHLAEKVFDTMAAYDDAIWKFLAEKNGKTVDAIALFNGKELAYAENRSQNPAHLFSTDSDDPLAPSKFEWVSGTPSYISMADGTQITEILCLLAESFRQSYGKTPYIAIAGKHGNPCGAAITYADTPLAIFAIRKALLGDHIAVMGGEVVTNFPIKEEEAEELFKPPVSINIGRENWGLDLIIAPEFSDKARIILGEREKRRLLSNPALKKAPFPKHKWVYRQTRTDWLRQKASDFILSPDKIKFWSGKEMNPEEFTNVLIAFACCWRASSNTVALAKNRMLIGIGCGQQDRIACVRLCLDRANRAGHDTKDSFFASDAFFPYAKAEQSITDQDIVDITATTKRILESNDRNTIKEWASLSTMISARDRREGPQLLVDAGCIGGLVPADGKELENVHSFFQKNNLSVAFIPPECRGFSKH